jgi:hypothetical protein
MIKKNSRFFKGIVTVFFSISILSLCSLYGIRAFAASLTTPISDTQSSIKISVLSDHTIQFVTPTGVSAGQAISVTFPVEYSLGTFSVTNIDLATSTSASCTSFTNALVATTSSGLTWGASQSGQTITLTSGTAVIPANRCVQVKIGSNATFGGQGVSQITNPALPGNYLISIGGSFGDTGLISETILSDDAVAVTGTVSQALTFSISTSTIYFGILGSSGAKYASSTNAAGDTAETVAHTLAVSTNAPSGFNISVQGQTLTSQQNPSNTITQIGSTAASSTPGNEQFGIRATESGGVGTSVSPPFSFSTSYGYGATATTSEILATGTGSTLTSTYSLYYVANIAAVTEAGTYAANLVYVATANF